jgi:hypothetical protein
LFKDFHNGRIIFLAQTSRRSHEEQLVGGSR